PQNGAMTIAAAGWREFSRELWQDLLSLLWPCNCVVCEAPNRELCSTCLVRLRRHEGASWVPLPLEGGAFVVGPYAGPQRALLVAYKHGGRIGFGRVLGAQLSGPLRAALSSNAATGQAPLIVTVPSRSSR